MRHASCIAAIIAAAAAVSAEAVTKGPDAFGYLATDEVAYAWEDISGTGKLVLTSDDDAYASADLNFTFTFYDQDYTKVYWSTNGLITFGAASTQFTNQDLTDGGATWTYDGPSVAALWDDWESCSIVGDGTYYYETPDSPGSRRFIVQWNLLRHNDDLAQRSQITFQALLYEGTNAIVFQYQDVAVGHTGIDNGLSATVGIRDTAGQISGRNLQWSYNQAVIDDGLAIRITIIPEPVTMGGLVLGSGSLATYLCRRRA